jgi:hypothetical protein
MSKIMIDVSRKQLTMADARFYYDEEGNYVPSVTTILNAYPKGPEYYQWLKKVGTDADEIRDAAGERGSTVHNLTELYDSGEEVSLLSDNGGFKYRMDEWSMFERYTTFINKCHPQMLLSEETFVSRELGFAGTIDRIMTIGATNYLVDIKTSSSIWESYWLQLAAYRKLYEFCMRGGEAIPIHGVAVLWLNSKTRTEGKNGAIQGEGWQLAIRDEKQAHKDWELFCHTHVLWNAQNGDVKPKNLTYKLSYKKA